MPGDRTPDGRVAGAHPGVAPLPWTGALEPAGIVAEVPCHVLPAGAGVTPGGTEVPELVRITVPLDAVRAQHHEDTLQFLSLLLLEPALIRSYRERVDVVFEEFGGRRPVFEDVAAREYVAAVDAAFPYWLFFVNERTACLSQIVHCFLPPFLAGARRAGIHGRQVEARLEGRWLPAAAAMAQSAGLSRADQHQLVAAARRTVEAIVRSGPGATGQADH